MIYLLEDDTSIRELVIYTMNSAGMEAEGFEKPSAFWKAMKRQIPTLLLLDIMLPEEDGLSILTRLRADDTTAQMPIIMLTAKGSEYDKVIGLDKGADDYLPKPFGMMELIARVKALLRRAEMHQSIAAESEQQTAYTVGDLYVCPAKHIVAVHGEPVVLTLKEFDLLCFLLKNRDIVFTRDQLLNQIWGYSFDGESRTVDVHVRSLRSKLGSCCEIIETVRGIGYKISR